MNADILKRVVRAIADGSLSDLDRLAPKIVDAERKSGHVRLAEQLEAILNDFLALLGYWTLAFGLILALEHFWFRPRLGGYDLGAWQDPKRLPVGVAATTALLLGIGFSFVGMDQTWVCGWRFPHPDPTH